MNSTIVEPHLSFSLDAANGVPIYRQIIQQIEYAILSERMRPGDKLPTIRSLAVALKINPNTIAKAYGELEIRGILATQVGSGTYVSDKAPLLGEALSAEEGLNRKIREVLGRFVQEMRDLGVDKAELPGMIRDYKEGEAKDD
ncbi:MAG: GntR family transcriptional regulator [Treponema sp.]|jgi:GntR family transcriptional regulator|nr:GntR family transcriptional regulator [Treponema sp.]